MDPVRIAVELFSGSRTFPVVLWNGDRLAATSGGGVRGRLVLRSPRALEALMPPTSEARLAGAYLDGDVDLEGDAIGLLEAAARWEGPRLRPALLVAAGSLLLRRALPRAGPGALAARLRGPAHSRGRDRDAVRHHYDVSDEFYRLFLDRDLVYSCGYFAGGGERIGEAQRAKLELVCRKLNLAPGERLLDVGCGWGALLSHAAATYQVHGLGITLSEHQLAEARRRFARAPRACDLSAEPIDYRVLDPGRPFHKVASIGMMEHVGRARLAAYFSAIYRVMAPGGLFLNHAIADLAPGTPTLPWAGRGRAGFIARYIFPDAELIPVGEVVRAAERAGFEVRDLESLREHYAETLAAWLAKLEARFDEAVSLVGRRRARAYRLYLASSSAAFRLGRIGVFQLLLAKRTADGCAQAIPRCRGDWYRPWLAARRPAPPAHSGRMPRAAASAAGSPGGRDGRPRRRRTPRSART